MRVRSEPRFRRRSSIVIVVAVLSGSTLAPAAAVRLHTAALPIASLDVARAEDGSFVAVWAESDLSVPGSRGYLRRYDAAGVPLAAALEVWPHDPSLRGLEVRLDEYGKALVVAHTQFGLSPNSASQSCVAMAFEADGTPLWGPTTLAATGGLGSSLSCRAGAAPQGGWMAIWAARHPALFAESRLYARTISATRGPTEEPQWLATLAPPASFETPAVGGTESTLLAAWLERESQSSPPDRLVARGLGPDGSFDTPAVLLASSSSPEGLGSLAVDGIEGGDHFVVWRDRGSGAETARTFGVVLADREVPGSPRVLIADESAVDRNGRAMFVRAESYLDGAGGERVRILRRAESVVGSPLSGDLAIGDLRELGPAPAVAVSNLGNWIAAWAGLPESGGTWTIDASLGRFGDGCESDPSALCLAGGRFRATASYFDHLGRSGSGFGLPVTDESGAFWFFSATHLELFVKVVDACTHPDFGNFWVFASGLTDVQVELAVVDTWSGEAWRRSTSLGEPFPPVLDTAAFFTCDAASATSSPSGGR